jgi:RHS repeat-associated protein
VDSTDKWEWTIYDPRWRRVATYMVAGGTTIAGSADADPKERYVHHAAGRSGGGSYLDSVILRDRDQTNGNNGVADGTLEQRLYYGQNWRADTVVLMSSTGRILERLTYSAYGVATRHPVADFNRDGFTDFFDDLAYDDCFTGSGCPAGQTADLNLDGVADMFDYDEWDLSYAEQVNTARGVLSQNDASAAVNRLGYAGYWFEPSTQQYLVRHREYDPNTGVWDERDPMGYHDGADLYMYVSDNPVNGWDSMGLLQSSGGCGSGSCNPDSSPDGQSTSTPAVAAIVPIDTSSCGSLVAQCMAHDQAVRAILTRLAARTPACPVPAISCENCGAGTADDARYRPAGIFRGPIITICANRMSTGSQVCRALAHELMHRESDCAGSYPNRSGGCAAIVCEERRAIEGSGQCCRDSWYRRNPPALCGGAASSNWTYSECVQCYTNLSSGWRCGTLMPPPAGKTGSPTFFGDFNSCPGTPNCAGLGGQ